MTAPDISAEWDDIRAQATFILNKNDIRGGGKAIPIACVIVGRMVNVLKDSYTQVYRNNRSYHYPCIPTNKLRTEGVAYFQNVKLTGWREGTAKDSKISLLKVYKETIVPALEETVVRKYSVGGTNVSIIKQEDGAGLHQEKAYLS